MTVDILQAYCEGLPVQIVYDVGANDGGYTVVFSRQPFVRAVHAFEPIPETFAQLATRCGSDPKVVLNNVAVGAEPGRLEDVSVCNAWSLVTKACSLSSFKVPGLSRFSVNVITLDEYWKKQNHTVDCIKLDVDGYELRVLQGAQELLARDTPFIYLELSVLPARMDLGSVDEIVQFLTSRGYQFYYQFRDGQPLGNPGELAAETQRVASFDIGVVHSSKADVVSQGIDKIRSRATP